MERKLTIIGNIGWNFSREIYWTILGGIEKFDRERRDEEKVGNMTGERCRDDMKMRNDAGKFE